MEGEPGAHGVNLQTERMNSEGLQRSSQGPTPNLLE